MTQNATISYYCLDDEEDILVAMYNRAYNLALDYEDITLIYVNLSGRDTVTIDDLSYPIPYGSYSEYNDYSIEDLEEQISLIYKEFYTQGILYAPIVIIIHDVGKMCDCGDEYDIITYLNDKLAILEIMQIYVFCSVKE